jgi:hypothetical protein
MKMIAIEQGFYCGRRVRPGAEFEFNERDGKPPKWAVPAGTPIPTKVLTGETKPGYVIAAIEEKNARIAAAGRGELVLGDCKPVEAMAAAAAKTGVRPTVAVEHAY